MERQTFLSFLFPLPAFITFPRYIFFPPSRRAVRKISRPLLNPRYRACPTMWIRNRGNSYTILEMAIIAKVRCHDRNLIIRKLDSTTISYAAVSAHKFLFKNVVTRSINASLVDQNLLRTMEPVEFPELYFLYVSPSPFNLLPSTSLSSSILARDDR